MHGEQIDAFLTLCPKIITFFNSHFEDAQTMQSLVTILQLCLKIDNFLRITYVSDEKQCEKEILEFKSNLKCHQIAASQKIHTNNAPGDAECFCTHVLFCHCPKLVDKIWKEHKPGVGIFALQGMERRNKESKNATRRFCNSKHNVCNQKTKRVFDKCW